ncbi:hypothetical protein C2G38_2202356 [Gigaspora rosea]|uniref:Uncharacterized protein n=1 Tax=Gigaspora rosea TaxID=44941 RepID=A0A397UX75_9GLOM|nr:hypothetical protein C2G38_2202356 [Gigaspora rosea]
MSNHSGNLSNRYQDVHAFILGGIVFALAGDHLVKILEEKYPNTNPLMPNDSNETLSSQAPVDNSKSS